MDEDWVKNYWEKYIDEDYFGRKEILNELLEPRVKDMKVILDSSMNDEAKLHFFVSMFQGYFDDIIKVLEAKANDMAIENMGDDR